MHHLERDGVRLFYEEAGRGAPPILFVHGGACDHTHFAPQVGHFSHDHRVVAVDLRGHGQSDKPVQEYTIGRFSDDLAWLSKELGLYKPIVVGHSLGGVVVLDLAARYPDLPAAIVMLDAPLLIPQPVADALNLEGLIAAMQSPACHAVLRGFIGSTIMPTDNKERSARILEAMDAVPAHVITSAFPNALRYDASAAAAACKVPALYVRAGVPADLDRFRSLCPQLHIGQTVGSGHFHQLEVPDEINAMLDRFLVIALPRPVDGMVSADTTGGRLS